MEGAEIGHPGDGVQMVWLEDQMRTPERFQPKEERKHPYDHVRYGGDLDALPLPHRVINRRGELDRGNGVCDPLLGAELDAAGDPFPIIFATC